MWNMHLVAPTIGPWNGAWCSYGVKIEVKRRIAPPPVIIYH